MHFTISNHYLTAKVDSLGAELISLKKSGEETEYIWKADPDVWGRHAPILFPIVGRLKNDEYQFKGKNYSLGQHGFARNLPFNKIDDQPDSLTFELRETEETLQVYPFQFALRVSFHLWKNILYTTYTVFNPNDDLLFFSIGGHPGFTCPIEESGLRSDYYLEFEKSESCKSYILEGGNLSKETKQVINNREINIEQHLFDEDALIFKELKSDKISLKHKSGKAILHVHFPNFPYLGIWSMNQSSPYVCIEPWFGLADNVDHDGELTSKEGICTLEPNEEFTCEFGIEVE